MMVFIGLSGQMDCESNITAGGTVAEHKTCVQGAKVFMYYCLSCTGSLLNSTTLYHTNSHVHCNKLINLMTMMELSVS